MNFNKNSKKKNSLKMHWFLCTSHFCCRFLFSLHFVKDEDRQINAQRQTTGIFIQFMSNIIVLQMRIHFYFSLSPNDEQS